MLAYWYEGGRPSGCWGFIADSEVDEAAGLEFVFVFVGVGLLVLAVAVVAVLTVGTDDCDWDEVMLFAADEAPLTAGGCCAAVAVGGERLLVEELEGAAG